MNTAKIGSSRYQYLTLQPSPSNPNIAIITLNRPRKRNAINAQMWREIGHVFRNLDVSLYRVVLLRGAGANFSSGIDLSDPKFSVVTMGAVDGDENDDSNIETPDFARRVFSSKQMILDMQSAFTALELCPIPVIAAIHGPCIGGGIDLVCAADVRLCSHDAIFSVREVKLGLAADVGTLQRLPKVVGQSSRVRELCLTGEDFDAMEAHRIGFVSRVLSNEQTLMEDALRVCDVIASNSPVAVVGTKSALIYARDHSVAEGLEQIASHNSAALATDDIVASFVASKGGKGEFAPLLPLSRL
mmetsp:Transcript_2807/g.4399  ORF Transcript_2807/g.4399 Transcript_2807/m.4399 type:complete len:301 (-) Transcript_2807:414-1316(-)|eukprot:CAMPEP_0196821216 /NCGR_PEP_ID=MMETSP1362-20130617/78230_1 /TAXON_ID=163516 /ORGANISM="Leptocylindrus danicus, Strain CCMP1856" /LENGTH=300 /DNA_ID=CAMNT_0042200331 /DNA_START=146 /DNA_END=1048 /DNA_ORIENTATION=+